MAGRGSGEGGIFQRESDGRWVATVELGKGPNEKRLRKVVYGSTKRGSGLHRTPGTRASPPLCHPN